jgi:DHA2 family multidrug resistance protein
MLVQGFSMSVFFVALITITLAEIPAHKTPAAAGLSNFSRYTAGSFAASITTTIWDNRETLHQSRLAENAHAGAMTGAMAQMGRLGMSGGQALASITNTVVRQAYAMASLDFFWMSGWLMLALIPLLWLTRRPAAPAAGAGGD